MSSLRMTDHAPRDIPQAVPATTQPRLSSVLSAIFNCFALNGLLVVACLPIVTIPASLRAAVVALDRWRRAEDDRVARVFWGALSETRWPTVTAGIGAPIAGALLACAEVQSFAGAHTPADALCLGLAACALFICLASLGYSIVLCARYPAMGPLAIWSAAVSLAIRHAIGTSALLVAEVGLLAALVARDPALTVVCVPLGLLAMVRASAARSIDRAIAANGEQPGATPNHDLGEGGGR